MSNNKYKILVIEDENNIRSFMQAILESNGYQVINAETGMIANMMITSHNPDLIILDLGLPDMDGQKIIPAVRSSFATPILVVSARVSERDKVEALDLGANDYITKPFGTAELLARVRAALRVSRHQEAEGTLTGGTFKASDLFIDYDKRQVKVSGEKIELTQTEYNILVLLSYYAGKVLTYDVIIRSIWGGSEPGSVKKLQVNMANIRRKLDSKPGTMRYVYTEMGVGYRLIEPDEVEEE